MIDIAALSREYAVRRLDDSDADGILALCEGNPQFYRYCEARPSREQVLRDLHITPPGVGLSDKYYVGFYQEDVLVAVMDLIDGYPEPEIAFIGFVMMSRAFQGRHVGSAIIREAAAYLQAAGKTAIRLAIDKANPQSTHFWKRNGFRVIMEVEREGWTVLVAEKPLCQASAERINALAEQEEQQT